MPALTVVWGALQALTKQEFQQIFWPASMHAIGHVAANLSFAAVAISLTHTVKTLEPAFNVVLSRLLMGNATPLPVVATLIPIMVRFTVSCPGKGQAHESSRVFSNLTT